MDEAFLFFILILIAVFTVVAPIATWIVCVRMGRRMEGLENKFHALNQRLKSLTEQKEESTAFPKERSPEPEPSPELKPDRPPEPESMETITPEPERKPEQRESSLPPPLPKSGISTAQEPKVSSTPPPFTTSGISTPQKREPSDFERKALEVLGKIWNWLIVGEEHRKPGVPMEYAVATNWLVRVGVLIMVVGVGFFLDYSVEEGWLGPVGQVAIALLAGAAVMGAGLRLLNKKYHLLAQGFLGAGLAIWYVALYAGHIRFELFGASIAFGLMALVTACAAVMAVRFRSLLVAVLGILGGYGTPFMLPGAGNLVGLYVYLLVLGLGVLAVAHRRHWHLLNALAFALTTALVMVTLAEAYRPDLMWTVMPFVVAYFILFSTVVFVYQVVHRESATVLDLAFLLLNAAVFFGISRFLILSVYPRGTLSVVTVSLAAFYAAHLWVFLKRGGKDRGLCLSFLALAALFLSFTPPLLLSDQWLTAAWSLLALVLLWTAGRLGSTFLRQISLGLYLFAIGRFLLLDLETAFSAQVPSGTPVMDYLGILAGRLAAFGIPVASVAAAMRLIQRSGEGKEASLGQENDTPDVLGSPATLWTLGGLVFLMLLAYVQLELRHSFGFLYEPLTYPLTTVVWVGAAVFLLLLNRRFPHPAVHGLSLVVAAVTVGKLCLMDLNFWDLSFAQYRYRLDGGYSWLEAGLRLIDFGVLIGFLAYGFRMFGEDSRRGMERNIFGYGTLTMLLAYITFEINTLLEAYVPGLRAGGISVTWGLFALALVTAGLIRSLRPLRIVGLALFTLTAVKVFLVDLAQLDPVYKIVAFILLGVVLMFGAYAYLRFEDTFNTGKDSA